MSLGSILIRVRILTSFLTQIGAWSIESSLGRRRSLALFTLATAMAMFVFTVVVDEWVVVASSMLISLAGTAMYAVLCKPTSFRFLHEHTLLTIPGRRNDA